eukprot:g9207.t1
MAEGTAPSQAICALARSRAAVLWPPLAMLILAVLIVISHILAVLSGKCEVLEAGIQRTAYVEEISITTRKPPESYIWTLGVAVTWVLFLLPSTFFIHLAFFRPSSSRLRTRLRTWLRWGFLGISEAFFVLASLALVGLATITHSGTILENQHQIPGLAVCLIHQQLSILFFLASFLSGGFFLAARALQWRSATKWERRSFWLKLAVLIFLILCELIPPLRSGEEHPPRNRIPRVRPRMAPKRKAPEEQKIATVLKKLHVTQQSFKLLSEALHHPLSDLPEEGLPGLQALCLAWVTGIPHLKSINVTLPPFV